MTFRKRKATEDTPQTSKKRCNRNDAPNNVLIPETAVVEDDDETLDVKPMLIVKLPKKSRDTGGVIVIDSEDDDSDHELLSAPDINCENGETTPAQNNTQKTKGPQDKESTSKKVKRKSNTDKDSEADTSSFNVTPEPTKTARIHKDSEADASSSNVPLEPKKTTRTGKDPEVDASSSNIPSEPKKTTRSVRTQTLLPDEPGNTTLQLNNLRRNVAKLLRVILPDMGVFANIALENVDNALIEVLRVNDVSSDDQPVPSEQTTAAKNSATPKGDSKGAKKNSSSDKKEKLVK